MTAPTNAPLSGARPPLPEAGSGVPGPPPSAPTSATATAPPTFVKPGTPPPPGGFTTPTGGGSVPPGGPDFVKPVIYDGPPAPKAFALAALGLALFTGLFLAEKPAGVGVAMLSLGIVAACWTLIETERRGPFVILTLAGAAALGVVPAFRDSEWVTTLSLLGALTLTSIAVASARTWRETFVGMFGWAVQLFPAPLVFFGQGIKRASSRRWSLAGPVARGITLAAFLVFVFGALFSAADEQFAEVVRDLTDWDLDFASIVVRSCLFAVVLAMAGALWLVSATRKDRPAKEASTKLGRTEWTIALAAVVVLFAGFVALQLPEFFGGDNVVQLTAGLTYAENARTGFVQLTLAAMLTLLVVAGAVRYGPAGDLTVRLLSGALCLLTVVVLVSALHRLGLYTGAYGQTRTRFTLYALMLWLGAVLLLVVVAGGAQRTGWLPRTLVLISAVFALGTVVMNPDARVAERNVERFAETGQVDPRYLATLSADALPELKALPTPMEECVASEIAGRTLNLDSVGTPQGDPLVGLNLGRARGRDAIEGVQLWQESSAPCAGLTEHPRRPS